MKCGLWNRMAGGLNRRGRGFFYAKPPFTFLLIVGENVARRTEATRLGRSSCNCPDARIFATLVAAAHASLHARLLARPSLARAGRGRHVQVLNACIGGSGARIFRTRI